MADLAAIAPGALFGDAFKLGGTAAGLVGSFISADGTLAAGQAAQQAGELSAETSIASSQLASTAALNSSQLTATAQEEAGQFGAESEEFQAEQLTQNASTTRAQAQRQALDIDQQTRLALSTLRARASGSGLSATGSTPVAIAGQIGARGAYEALGVMAAGENTARGLEDEATASRITGAADVYGGNLSAIGTIYSGQSTSVADLYSGEASAAAARLQGNAALQAATSKADATIASGIGSAMTNIGAIMFPTPTGKAGATVG